MLLKPNNARGNIPGYPHTFVDISGDDNLLICSSFCVACCIFVFARLFRNQFLIRGPVTFIEEENSAISETERYCFS